MAEQYMDSYQNKYREETTQIHAPLSLIEKTKAAVREEEKRLAAAVQGKEEGPANQGKQKRVFSIQKWAYPLTAAAAVLILASVSLTMRGIKSVNMSDMAMPATIDEAAESGAVYESAVESADAGYMDDAMSESAEAPAAGAVETPMMEAAASEEEMLADMVENTAAPAEEKQMEESAENTGRGPADKASQKNTADAQKKEAAGEQERGVAGQEDYTIEKVKKCPDRFSGSDVKIHHYEGKSFRVLETASSGNSEGKIWEAYVETAGGEGCVISGEAESVEDFLETAWEKLEEGE